MVKVRGERVLNGRWASWALFVEVCQERMGREVVRQIMMKTFDHKRILKVTRGTATRDDSIWLEWDYYRGKCLPADTERLANRNWILRPSLKDNGCEMTGSRPEWIITVPVWICTSEVFFRISSQIIAMKRWNADETSIKRCSDRECLIN